MKNSVRLLSLMITFAMFLSTMPLILSFASAVDGKPGTGKQAVPASEQIEAVGDKTVEETPEQPEAVREEHTIDGIIKYVGETMPVQPDKKSFRLPSIEIGTMTVTNYFLVNDEYCEDRAEAGSILRAGMKARENAISIKFKAPTSEVDNYSSYYSSLFYDLIDIAEEHTGLGTEGDYLKWHVRSLSGPVSIMFDASYYYFDLTVNVTYYATAEQEQELDAACAALLSSLNIRDASDYDKVKAIYDYMCANIVYDYDNLSDDSYTLKYSAYAALINGTAVCQGYANLFYRLALSSGVDTRLIAGTGNGGNHAWNIVQIGDLYYDLDSTWGASYYSYDKGNTWFLKSEADFSDHSRAPEYATDAFNAEYPMSNVSFTAGTGDPGANTYEYSYCDASADHAHNFEWQITDDYAYNADASCTEGVTYRYTCSCGEHSLSDLVFEIGDPLGHDYNGVVTQPSCTEQGYTTFTCTRCNDSYVGEYVDPIAHTLTHVAETASTAESDGNVEYWHCEECGKYFSDGQGTNEIGLDDTVIPALTRIPGDVDGDGVLTSDDALALLYNIFFYETTPEYDYDGNGAVTSDDATYLLYHIFFADAYPLN